MENRLWIFKPPEVNPPGLHHFDCVHGSGAGHHATICAALLDQPAMPEIVIGASALFSVEGTTPGSAEHDRGDSQAAAAERTGDHGFSWFVVAVSRRGGRRAT